MKVSIFSVLAVSNPNLKLLRGLLHQHKDILSLRKFHRCVKLCSTNWGQRLDVFFLIPQTRLKLNPTSSTYQLEFLDNLRSATFRSATYISVKEEQ